MIKNLSLTLILSIAVLATVNFIFRRKLLKAGYTITSSWRTPFKNIEVGGKIFSRHLFGLAFDVKPKGTIDEFKKVGFAYVVDERDHFHGQLL